MRRGEERRGEEREGSTKLHSSHGFRETFQIREFGKEFSKVFY